MITTSNAALPALMMKVTTRNPGTAVNTNLQRIFALENSLPSPNFHLLFLPIFDQTRKATRQSRQASVLPPLLLCASRVQIVASPCLFNFHTPTLETILGSFSISANGSARIMQRQDEHEKQDCVKAKTLFEEIHDMQVKQTSGSDLTATTQHATSYLATRLSSSYLSKVMVSQNGVMCIPLKYWTRELQVLAMQDVFLGPAMELMSPGLPSILFKYSKVSWQT
ncbi:hypothetical protein P171DRAFT_448147 [Karstenula rhodostoma CBS 690.94]|uniref:Uncharacterized protein n=1 Tax=Karstenula rhodostoma CBS 690.94 TaxID=1392251 RepID=A0A9P4U6Q5_9PLEO|nr:hypothetical protein P171DRAFT_448147 [Karstenula rhodostoma CBS 690.94]